MRALGDARRTANEGDDREGVTGQGVRLAVGQRPGTGPVIGDGVGTPEGTGVGVAVGVGVGVGVGVASASGSGGGRRRGRCRGRCRSRCRRRCRRRGRRRRRARSASGSGRTSAPRSGLRAARRRSRRGRGRVAVADRLGAIEASGTPVGACGHRKLDRGDRLSRPRWRSRPRGSARHGAVDDPALDDVGRGRIDDRGVEPDREATSAGSATGTTDRRDEGPGLDLDQRGDRDGRDGRGRPAGGTIVPADRRGRVGRTAVRVRSMPSVGPPVMTGSPTGVLPRAGPVDDRGEEA